jgi:hypothetical protein
MSNLIDMLGKQNSEYFEEIYYLRKKNRVIDTVLVSEEDRMWFVAAVLDRNGVSTAVIIARMLFSSLSLKEAYDMVKSLEKGE